MLHAKSRGPSAIFPRLLSPPFLFYARRIRSDSFSSSSSSSLPSVEDERRRQSSQPSANTQTRARARLGRERGAAARASRYTRGTNTVLVYKPKGVIENTPASYLSIWPGGIVDEARGSSLCISSPRAVAVVVVDTCSREKAEDGNGGTRGERGYRRDIFALAKTAVALSLATRTCTRRRSYPDGMIINGAESDGFSRREIVSEKSGLSSLRNYLVHNPGSAAAYIYASHAV